MTIFQGHTNEYNSWLYSNIIILHKYWSKLSILLLIFEMNLLEFILLFFFGFIRVNTLNSIPLSSRFLFICNFSSVYFFLKTTFPQFVVISIHLIASFVPLSARSLTKRGVPQSFHTDSNTQGNYGCPFFFVKSALSPLFSTFFSAR